MTESKIDVFIPTYNRAHFLTQALDCLCDQGLPRGKYVVVISDNCSEDDTPAVVEEYRDRLEIVYHRNEKNIGGRANWDIAMGLSESPYFVWLPDDDLLAPGQLGRALSVLETHDNAVLFATMAVLQQWPGHPDSLLHGQFLKADAQTSYSEPYVWDRTEWLALALVTTPLSLIGSVFQRSAFDRCELWRRYQMWADRSFLAEMALYGDVVSLPWIGGYYRTGEHQTNHQQSEIYGYEFDLVTQDILALCKEWNLPVIEFWADQLRRSTYPQKEKYSVMLKRTLPPAAYQELKELLPPEMRGTGRLERWGVPESIADLLRTVRHPVRMREWKRSPLRW